MRTFAPYFLNRRTLEILKKEKDLRSFLDPLKADKKTIAFVPTMGSLHEGHLSLIELAKKEADYVVCSIFVNPTQFNDKMDFLKYPKEFDKDIALLEKVGCDFVFIPYTEDIYPEQETFYIDLGKLDQELEGKRRPGHFLGVCQIVNKLMNLVQPDFVIFGEKDLQQIKVVEKLFEKMEFTSRIISGPTVRDSRGLALSSRNERLSEEGLEQAPLLYNSLKYVKDRLYTEPLDAILKTARAQIMANKNFGLEYLFVYSLKDFKRANEIDPNKSYAVLGAARLEGIRLIDNLIVHPKSDKV